MAEEESLVKNSNRKYYEISVKKLLIVVAIIIIIVSMVSVYAFIFFTGWVIKPQNLDLCNNVICNPYCSGNTLHYNGKCVNGQCDYTNLICDNGCSNEKCNSPTLQPSEFCGDGICQSNENYINCQSDCPKPIEVNKYAEITVIDYDPINLKINSVQVNNLGYNYQENIGEWNVTVEAFDSNYNLKFSRTIIENAGGFQNNLDCQLGCWGFNNRITEFQVPNINGGTLKIKAESPNKNFVVEKQVSFDRYYGFPQFNIELSNVDKRNHIVTYKITNMGGRYVPTIAQYTYLNGRCEGQWIIYLGLRFDRPIAPLETGTGTYDEYTVDYEWSGDMCFKLEWYSGNTLQNKLIPYTIT